jgi:hypothetical protein
MTCEDYKDAFKAVLPSIPIPPKNRKLLIEAGLNPNDDPYNGHCARATEAAYVLFGRKLGLKPFKNKVSGRASHYWLANPLKGKELEVCDPIVFGRNLDFDYKCRKGVGWISRKRTRKDLSREALRIYDAVVKHLGDEGSR